MHTTHVSGVATELGIELAIAFDILCGREPEAEARHNQTKLRLHLYTIAAFLIGGILGVIIYRAIGGYLLILAGGLLTMIALDAIRRAKRTPVARASASAEISL